MLLFLLLTIKFLLFQYFTKISYSPWLVFAVDMIFLSLFYFLSKKEEKSYKIVSLVLYSLMSLLLFADVVYFTYFNRMPSVNELGHAANLGDVMDAVVLLIKFKNLIFLLDLPILIYLAVKKKIHRLDHWVRAKGGEWTDQLPLLCLCASLLVVFMGASRLQGIKDLELFSYHTRDILGIQHQEEELSVDEEMDDLQGTEETSLENDWTGIAQGKNLIIIQVESLNNFVIHKKYEGQVITPRLNALIEEEGTIYAEDYFEMLGAGNTSDAEFVSLHSLYPSMKNPSYEVYSGSYVYGLPKILKDKGYENTAFHNYKRDFWIRDTAYPHIGFDRFIAEDNYDVDEIIGMGLSDKSFFRQSVPYLEKMQSPFFAFLVTLTSHIPYEMPESELKLSILPEDKGSIFGNYMNSIHYTDAAIGEFIDDLKANGLYDDSVIVIYGDHHGLNGSDKKDNERIAKLTGIPFDFDTMLNIPLIIHIGGVKEKALIEHVCSQIDLTPTLLNLFGIDRSQYVMFGHDIMGENHPAVLYPQSYMLKGSYIDDDHIFNMGRDGIFENGTLKERKTGKRVDNEIAREKHKRALKEISICKQILERDKIKSLMAGGPGSEPTSEEDLLKRDMELTDALDVNSSYEILQGYRAGFNTFRLELHKTRDGYFVSKDHVNIMDYERIRGDFISLGSLIGGQYPEDVRFIIHSEDMTDLVYTFRSLPGLYTNIILEVDDPKEYEFAANKQNGYKILYHGEERTEEELRSMAEINGDLYFYGIDVKELDDLTYHRGKGKHQIYAMEEADLSYKRDMPTKDDPVHIRLSRRERPYTYEELLQRKSEVPVVLPFVQDPDNGHLSIAKVEGNARLTSENIHELLSENPHIRIAVDAPEFTVEILRNLLSHHPDTERIIPILHGTTQAPFARRMGYSTYVLDVEAGSRELEEMRLLWGAKLPQYH